MTLRELRKSAGFSQAALAQAAGVNIRQIQKVEAGEILLKNMTLKNAVGIANALCISPESLLTIEEGA